jgi:hypothetical protein
MFFSFKNEWGEPRLLDHTHEQPGRNPREESGEQNPPDHGSVAASVAGKADSVACIVGGVVHGGSLCQPDTKNQDAAQYQ